ncbi:VOC family protein [Aliamphritea spongicola]|nr:VOC family protein [Aliamphritea spongicola]
MIKIYVTSIPVEDQDKALDFYTRILGFIKKKDIPLGEHKWLTVVSRLNSPALSSYWNPWPLNRQSVPARPQRRGYSLHLFSSG